MTAMTLSELVEPIGKEAFLKGHWPSTMYCTGARPLLAQRVREASPLVDIEELVSSYGSGVSLLHKSGASLEGVSGDEALAKARDGWTCYLRRVHENSEQLSDWIASVAADLATPIEWMSIEIFWSRSAGGVSMHSDYDANLALLLEGNKRWHLAPNLHLREQPGVCLGGSRRQPDARVAQLTSGVELPDAMPGSSQVVEAGPGSLLFIPRGWWHQTETTGPTLQLNFVVKGPSFRDLALAAIDEAALADERWRRFAYGHAQPGAGDEHSRVVGRLLKELGDEIENGRRQ